MDKAYIKQELDNLAEDLSENDIDKLIEFARQNNLTLQDAIGEILSLGEDQYLEAEN